MVLKIRVISLEIEKWMRVKSKYKFHSSSDSFVFNVKRFKIHGTQLFSAQFSLAGFTLHRFKPRAWRGISFFATWNLSSFVASEKKVNYLIPVSVTKYLCHSFNINSKNFNDSHTKVSFFLSFIASHRARCVGFERLCVRGQQWVWFWKWIFYILRWKNGFRY